MKINLKKIIFLIGFLTVVVSIYFNVKAKITHKDEYSPELLSYCVINKGRKVILEFGPITPYIQKLYKSNKEFTPEILLQVEELGKQYNPTTIIFDDVEYTYDSFLSTLIVTGREGSVYATAYNFILNALNLVHEYPFTGDKSYTMDGGEFFCKDESSVIEKKIFGGDSENGKVRYSEEKLIKYSESDCKSADRTSWVKLTILPVDKIIIKGDVRRIGEGFTIIKSKNCLQSYSVKVIDMSDSKVDTLYTRAFWRLKFLEKVIFPEIGKQVKISHSCFKHTPLRCLTICFPKELKDNCTPVNKISFIESCCVVM